MAFANGDSWRRSARLATAPALSRRQATTIACVMGNLATYDGCLFQCRVVLSPVLHDGDGASHLRALWYRSGSYVARLQAARLAWLALAYSTDRHCSRTDSHSHPLSSMG